MECPGPSAIYGTASRLAREGEYFAASRRRARLAAKRTGSIDDKGNGMKHGIIVYLDHQRVSPRRQARCVKVIEITQPDIAEYIIRIGIALGLWGIGLAIGADNRDGRDRQIRR